jgi:hypothetical protein
LEVVQTIALSMGLAWASGINLYATLFMLGVLQHGGHIALPPELAVVADPLVMFAAGLMYLIEFFADKIPGVDSGWDALHTFVRIPAGAVLAARALGDVSPAAELAAGLFGGAFAASSHALKAGTRLAINASPEPFSNIAASLSEDALVIGGLWTALHHPILFVLALVLFALLAAWALPKLWRTAKRIGTFLAQPIRRLREPAPGPRSPATGPQSPLPRASSGPAPPASAGPTPPGSAGPASPPAPS